MKPNLQKLLATAKNLLMLPARTLVSAMEKWDLEVNKIAGAVLLAGVIAMTIAVGTGLIYGEGHGGHEEIKRGYTIAGAEAFAPGGSGGAAAPAADTGPVDIAPFMATADAAKGATLIKRCTACHTFESGGKNGVGPNNFGIVGASHAHTPGFAYSEALLKEKGKPWTEQALSEFLENPKKAIPGNKMAFAGIKNPQERADLIAHLKTLK